MGFKAFMKGLWRGTKAVAPIILPLVPGGQVAATIWNAIAMAEESGRPGAEKLQLASDALQVASPLIIAQLEDQFQVDIPEEAVDKYIRAQTQATVDLMNAIGALPKKSAPLLTPGQ